MQAILKKYFNSRSLLLTIASMLVIFILINPPIDPDMWWHLRSGEFTFINRQVLLTDQFSFTMAHQPWVNAFWVADLFIYSLFHFGGFPLLILMIAVVGFLTFIPSLFSDKEPLIFKVVFVLLAAVSISPQWTARPQIFSFLLFSYLNYWLVKWEITGKGKLFLLPLYFVLWANIHGGFIWGILLLLATSAGVLFNGLLDREKFRQHLNLSLNLFFWTCLSIAAILLNPNGISIWMLPFHTISVSIANIQEWASPDFHLFINHPFVWMVLLLLLGYSISNKKFSFVNFFKTAGFLYMALVSQRNIPVAVLAVTPILIKLYSDMEIPGLAKLFSAPSEGQIYNLINIPINIGITLMMLVLLFWRGLIQTAPEQVELHYPARAVEWVNDNHPRGNLFNSYNYGGFLTWSLRDYPVFIDGRADLYGEKIIDDWNEIVNGGPHALQLLDQFNINLVLIEPDKPIVDDLIQNGWQSTYQDNLSAVLVRH